MWTKRQVGLFAVSLPLSLGFDGAFLAVSSGLLYFFHTLRRSVDPLDAAPQLPSPLLEQGMKKGNTGRYSRPPRASVAQIETNELGVVYRGDRLAARHAIERSPATQK